MDDRKGEHAPLIASLAGKGFVRVRIDGTVHEIDAVPKLDPKRNTPSRRSWTASACGADAAQRLAESFETATALEQRHRPGGIPR